MKRNFPQLINYLTGLIKVQPGGPEGTNRGQTLLNGLVAVAEFAADQPAGAGGGGDEGGGEQPGGDSYTDAQAVAANASAIQAASTADRQRANHTGTQAASTITQDANARFTTDAEKASWNAKQPALGYTAENAGNKVSNLGGNNATTYPNTEAVVQGLADEAAARTLAIGAATATSLNYVGDYPAAANPGYPTTGTGTAGGIRRGDEWTISSGGLVAGIPVVMGDVLRAKVANPGQLASNWAIFQANLFQATELLPGEVALATTVEATDENTTNDLKALTPKKGWQLIARFQTLARTISGLWSFSTSPTVPDATQPNQAMAYGQRLLLGTTATTASAGNHQHTASQITDFNTAVLALVSGGVRVLAMNTDAAVTGTGVQVETTLFTGTIPAGTLGPNGSLDIYTLFSMTSSGGSKRFKVKVGGVTIGDVSATTSASGRYLFTLTNRNSLTSQIGGPAAQSSFGSTGSTNVTTSADFGQPVEVTITATVTAATDTITLNSCRVTAYK